MIKEFINDIMYSFRNEPIYATMVLLSVIFIGYMIYSLMLGAEVQTNYRKSVFNDMKQYCEVNPDGVYLYRDDKYMCSLIKITDDYRMIL